MEDEAKGPRPIEDLLKLGTYQGMTDEEINMVVAYTAEVSAKQALFDANMDEKRRVSEAQAQAYRDSAAHADAVLDALIAEPLNLEVIADEQA